MSTTKTIGPAPHIFVCMSYLVSVGDRHDIHIILYYDDGLYSNSFMFT